MEGGNPHHGHQRQSEEEAVRDAGGGAVDVAEEQERTQAPPPVQEEAMEAAGDADHQFDSIVDSIAVGEAFAVARALQMEELEDVNFWEDGDIIAPSHVEGPAAVHGTPAESQADTEDFYFFPTGPPIFGDYDDVAGGVQPNANIVHQVAAGTVERHVVPTGQDVYMHEEPSASYQELYAAAEDLQIFAAAAHAEANRFVVDRAARASAANNNQQAAPAKATNNNQNQHAGTLLGGNQKGLDLDVDMNEEPSDSYQEVVHATAVDPLQNFAAAQALLNSFVMDRAGGAARAIAAANNQQAAPTKATNSQHAGTAAAGGADRRSSVPQPQEERGTGHVLSSASSAQGLRRRRQQGGCEVITLRLETPAGARATSRTVPGAGKEGIISARQAMLADAAQARSHVFLAGIEEEAEQGNSWYDSIVHDAQAMEAMDEPGLDDQVPFQQQFPRFNEEEPISEEPGYSPPKRLRVVDPCGLDLDEAAGPSTTTTRPTRVLPLADDEVPKFDCGICMEALPVLDLFHGMQCQHRFCVECMATYIEGRISAGEVPIPCPDPACPETYGEDIAVLHPEVCKKSIDFAAFSSWGDRLTERAIPANLRAYCPNRQCGVLLEATGGKTPAKAYCPVCSHPMCATCGSDWSHDDDVYGSSRHDCNEGPNAALVKKLAEKRRWKQCPRCKFLVEKVDGCNNMRCRCEFVFCYGCGLPEGRQTGIEQEAELCRCRQDDAAFQAVLGRFQMIIEHE